MMIELSTVIILALTVALIATWRLRRLAEVTRLEMRIAQHNLEWSRIMDQIRAIERAQSALQQMSNASIDELMSRSEDLDLALARMKKVGVQ